MSEPDPKRPVLLYLAAEGVLPVLAGCAGAAAAGPVGGVAGVAVGHAVERAINLFGRGIVARWRDWFAAHPGEAEAAVAGLAAVPPAEARSAARSILLDLAPDAAAEDLSLAVEFLTAIPTAVDRALVPDASGARSVPATVLWDDPRSLLQLLPEDVPPYPADAALAGTPYRLRELLGAGGFGAVYRAESPSLQHLPLAIKFCLDRSLLPALNQERSNLERLMRAGGRGAAHVVRLYGYDLDHPNPYLVYEFVPGGDLTKLLAARRAALGRPPAPEEVFGWVAQVAEGLAFAHAAGLVHRDLKPANILATAGEGDRGSGGTAPEPSSSPTPALPPSPPPCVLKLADFGLGGVAAARAVGRSRIGASTIDFLSLADQASLFRGAGTPLYMSPEQRRGAAPDPRHDLYALGVMWFQLLVGDVSRELPHGWAKELTVRYGVPADHVALIERCVGWMDERPKDAGELLPLLKAAAGSRSAPVPAPPPAPAAPDAPTVTVAVAPTSIPGADGRRRGLAAALARLSAAYDEYHDMAKWTFGSTARWGLAIALPVAVLPYVLDTGVKTWVAYTGFFLAPIVWGVYVFVMRSGVKGVADDLRKKIDAAVDEVAADFAPEVVDLGGRAALRHAPTVRRLRADLDPPAPAASPTSTSALGPDDVTADPTRKALLLARLADLQKTRKDTSDAVDTTWVGLGFGWLFLAPGVTWGAYATAHDGMKVDKGFALILAVAGFFAVLIGTWWSMAATRRAQRRKWDAAAGKFLADYPKLVAGWGGRAALDSHETVAAVTKMLDPDAARGGVGGWVRKLFGG